MGHTLHIPKSGVNAVNSLLKVVEEAFKHSNMDFRKTSYKSWRVLMDNFARDSNILRNTKRIKLIIHPLEVIISSKIVECR